MKLIAGDQIVLASHNAGKIREIEELLNPLGLVVVSSASLGFAEPEETGATFAANAIIKAEVSARLSGLPALSDDSGLCVHALGGDPGIYSARWAGPDKDFCLAMQKVQLALADKKDRRAYFVCALCIAYPDGRHDVFEGRIDGTLVWPPRGEKGFGYDPMFLPDGGELTFGEMEPEAKHAISHRAKAFSLFLESLR